MELPIITAVDLPGHYRLIRIDASHFTDDIGPGDIISAPALDTPLCYLRQSDDHQKMDFLIYLLEKNTQLNSPLPGRLLKFAVEEQQFSRPLAKLASAKKGAGFTERSFAAYPSVCEETSTGATKPFDAEAQLCKGSFRILAFPLPLLGQGLSIALDAEWQKHISLFLFEVGESAAFKLQPSQVYLPYLGGSSIGSIAMLEEKKVAARFYSKRTLPGCFNGTLHAFVQHIQAGLTKMVRNTGSSQIILRDITVSNETTPAHVDAPTLIEIVTSS